MFHTSTQKKSWVFSSQRELSHIRAETNAIYCQKHSDDAVKKGCQFLTSSEEQILCQYYMKKLMEFCKQFRPPVPRNVLGTAAAYFKRYYLYTSVMEYRPKDIYFCCAYLAFKIEEYNLSVGEFVSVLPQLSRENISTLVLHNELLMLKRLKFHLTVHSPFRPMEGFIIDMKTRSDITSIDSLRKEADDFLLKSLHSDVMLLYAPSQIALAALYHSGHVSNVDVSSYIKSVLLGSDETASKLFRTLESIQDLVANVTIPASKEIAHIEQRLEQFKTFKEIDPPLHRKRKSEEQLEEATETKRIKQDLIDRSEDVLSRSPLSGIGKIS